ncbi:MAG TPA: helix-turn-helix domain-containing protein [Bryobacteraceae bacterium]|nr:helix-turn-helix domain-containing protein [Bryobacteraceae bacterium]
MFELHEEKALDRIADRILSRIILALERNGNGKQQLPRLLTAAQAARYLGRKSPQSVYHLAARREIPCVRHGRNLRFDRLELDKWIESDKA